MVAKKQMDSQAKVIVKAILAEEDKLRHKHSWLRYQDALGLSILLVSFLGMLASGYAYYLELIPAWLTIVISALFASVSHEIEHDLIHRLYFRKSPLMHNFMMLLVWVMRPNTVSPWYRRGIHLLHHKTSGTEQDLEERLVGNGIANIWLRLLVICDVLLGMLARIRVLSREVKGFGLVKILAATFPLGLFYVSCWYGFLALQLFDFFAPTHFIYPDWISAHIPTLNFIVVVLIAPNFLRSACLNFVTSYMHYYGNVQHLMQQTQVLNSWLLAPVNLFCCNFGSTHSIHHFVVNQPFYLRQMLATQAHKVMQQNGVRFNDLTSISRANLYHAE